MERRRGQRSLSGVGDFGIQKSSRRPRSKRRRGVDKGGSRWRSCGGARGRLGSDAADAANPGYPGRGRSVRIEPREGPMGSTVTGVASSGRARAKTDLRRRVVGLCLACRVGGWGTGGRLSPASVRGPSGGRGRCGHVHSLRTERDGAVRRRYGARSGSTRAKASQRVGGDDTDTSLAAEGRRRNISPLDRERSRAAGHGRGEFAGWPNVLGHSPRASFDTNCRVA